MKDSEKLIEIDNLISDIEVNQEKANMMVDSIRQDYFELNNDNSKIFYFGKASIQNNILSDYVWENMKLLKQVRELLEGGTELCKK